MPPVVKHGVGDGRPAGKRWRCRSVCRGRHFCPPGACGSWRRARSPALHGKATGQQGRKRQSIAGSGPVKIIGPCAKAAAACKPYANRNVSRQAEPLRRGRSPALTPALRAGEPPKRRLRAAVISSARKRRDRGRLCRAKRALDREGRAAGSHRGGRERPPYNPPQMGAGKRNVSRKGKVSSFACRLPCIVGRAISPAGQHSGRRKAAGKVNVHPKHCGDRQLCGTMPSIVPYAGVLPAGSYCAGAELRLLHRRCAPGNLRNAACGRQ